MIKHYLFLDTNIFLHYQSFDSIPWHTVTSADVVELVLAPVIIQELDAQKFKNPLQAIRNKAKKTISKIYKLSKQELPVEVKKNLYLNILEKEADSDYFTTYDLQRKVNDDRLLARILEFKEQSENDIVRLVTADLGPSLKSKSLGIEILEMPGQYEIKDNIDAYKKKIRVLEKENLELKSTLPKLSLRFSNMDFKKHFTIKPHKAFSKAELDKKLNNERRFLENQLRDKISKPDENKTSIHSLALGFSPGMFYGEETIKRYRDDCDEYLSDYEKYYRESFEYENTLRLSITLELTLLNAGTTPAENIDVFLHFPDGFNLFSNDDFYREPRMPDWPTLVSPFEAFNRIPNLIVPHLNQSFDIEKTEISNVSSPIIKKSKSYDVKINVRYLKHNQRVQLEPLFVTFTDFEKAKGFSIEYCIQAANHPKEITGNLNVIIKKAISRKQ